MRSSSAEVIVFTRNASLLKQTTTAQAYKYGSKSDGSGTTQSASTLDRSKRSSVLHYLKKNITTSKRQHVRKTRHLFLGCRCSGFHRFRRRPIRRLPCGISHHSLLPPLRIHLPLDLQLQIRWLPIPLASLIYTADVTSFLIDMP
ncbi:uncharacterized protein LOC132941040 [Metopolophium dirhodum]|uniref:uncharacterized protein LOC132941040 n=1 Tax=Metopolophium dirhodum TaxID=44670 RepID=UPI00298F8BBC|nr:uncharacterized protein LOC132941040 [Metopolophium dirhodum]